MSLSNDAMIVLLARRSDLYEELGRLDGHVAAVQNSPFFSTAAGNAVTMRDEIEGVEGQIADIDRQIGHMRRRLADESAAVGRFTGCSRLFCEPGVAFAASRPAPVVGGSIRRGRQAPASRNGGVRA